MSLINSQQFNDKQNEFIFNDVVPLVWFRSDKLRKKDNKAPLLLRLTINGKQAGQGKSLKIYVKDEDFDRITKKVKESEPNHVLYNDHIQTKIKECLELQLFLEKAQKVVKPKEFLKMLEDKIWVAKTPEASAPTLPTIADLCDKFLKEATLTKPIVKTLTNHLKYVILPHVDSEKPAQEYKRRDFDKIGEKYLATPSKRKEKHDNQRQNYLNLAMVSLGRVFRWCLEEEIIPKNNFVYTSTSLEFAEPIFNTLEELQLIRDFDAFSFEFPEQTETERKIYETLALRQKYANAKECYLFCCYTGLYVSDYKNLCKKNKLNVIEIEENGKIVYLLKGQRQKGRGKRKYGYFELRLFGYAKELWIKTGGKLPEFDITPQGVSDRIRVVQKLLNIKTPMSNKIARSTFAHHCLNSWDVPERTIIKMIGHKTFAMLEKYARLKQNTILRDTSHLEDM